MELSNRMMSLVHMIPEGSTVCDIGCDHGFVSIYLVEHGICPHVLAMDVGEGPLSRAKEHIAKADLEAQIETRLSDGFASFEIGDANVAVIAGMGGPLMIRILEDSMDKVKSLDYLVLEPQSELPEMRAYLEAQNMGIVREDLVLEDGKFYPVLLVKPGQVSDRITELIRLAGEKEATGNLSGEEITKLGHMYGVHLLLDGHPVLKEYLAFRENAKRTILPKVKEHPKRVEEIEEELRYIHYAKSLME